MKFKLDFYSSYNQFFICDKNAEGSTASLNFWSEEAFEANMAIDTGVLGIGTCSYGYVRGELEILNAKPFIDDFSMFDHVVEASIEVKSGGIEVFGCTNFEDKISMSITNGTYRVRVYGSNFDTVLETDLDNETDNDFYKIEIWPGNVMERKVLKQFPR